MCNCRVLEKYDLLPPGLEQAASAFAAGTGSGTLRSRLIGEIDECHVSFRGPLTDALVLAVEAV